MTAFLITAGFGYFLGSIPFGYLLVRLFRGQDVRQTGSGNIGATNVSRTSPGLGVLTLVLDALKGTAAVVLTRLLFPGQPQLYAVAALCAIAGHMFPLWLGFRGGKGVATALGSFVVLTPKAILVALGIFVLIFVAFRYVSLASVVTVALFPFAAWALGRNHNPPQVFSLMAAASALIIAKHHENIRRLLAHTESRFQWSRR